MVSLFQYGLTGEELKSQIFGGSPAALIKLDTLQSVMYFALAAFPRRPHCYLIDSGASKALVTLHPEGRL